MDNRKGIRVRKLMQRQEAANQQAASLLSQFTSVAEGLDRANGELAEVQKEWDDLRSLAETNSQAAKNEQERNAKVAAKVRGLLE